ncbi:MAG: hypothetical protein RSG77_15305, partial [Hafnia sp.]
MNKAIRLALAASFVNPEWLNEFRHGNVLVAVNADGDIEVGGERLYAFSVDARLIPGEMVEVFVDEYFYCLREVDAKEMREQSERRNQQRAEEELTAANRLREEAQQFYSAYSLPFSFVVSIKDVLSGLSENSMGNGTNKRTVFHLRVLEDVSWGRTTRKSGDLLCTHAAGSNGKQWCDEKALVHTAGSTTYN